MECRKDARLRSLVNASGLATPDGMPLVWLTRLHGFRSSARVYGPDLMLALCGRSQTTGHRHFFYGGAPGVAERLVENLRTRFPKMVVAGTSSPPFRPIDEEEAPAALDAITATRPDVIWSGLARRSRTTGLPGIIPNCRLS